MTQGNSKYRPSDPQFQVFCISCRYNVPLDHQCKGTIKIPSGQLEGTYRCACFGCNL